MFIPTTLEEVRQQGWDHLDIILISGDTYIDHYYNGIAIIGKYLISKGYKVGIIAQPDISSQSDITRLGEPRLFWGISGGSVDSMVSNYTANRKKRNQDDMTPGLVNNRRPDRAVIAYTNLVRKYFKKTVPIVLGGLEASLRRIAHYDYWSNKIRRSLLFDSKADILVYGMGEKTSLQLAEALKNQTDYRSIKGICYKADDPVDNYISLPHFEEVQKDKQKFLKMFKTFYSENNPFKPQGLCQKHNDKYLIHNPPQLPLVTSELDEVYNLDYERDIHPYYKKEGEVRALTTIKFSVTTHRGCFGECNFCSITIHQGKEVTSRSQSSIIAEVKRLTEHPDFKGIINDRGGPTANMYAMGCKSKSHCTKKRCLYPETCDNLIISHSPQLALLKKIKKIPGIKKVFIASGIRYDLLLSDHEHYKEYIENLAKDHVSGQLKVAPEHTDKKILQFMGKRPVSALLQFKKLFELASKKFGKKQFMTYYFIAAHPGCRDDNMRSLKHFIRKELKIKPEQVQIFTPTPSTFSTLMYYTGLNPDNNKSIFVEKELSKKIRQKKIITD